MGQAGYLLGSAVTLLGESRDDLSLASAREALAEVRLAQGHYESALALYRASFKTFQQRERHDRALIGRANIAAALLRMSRYDEAGAMIAGSAQEEASALSPCIAKLHCTQAALHASLGDWDTAETSARKAIESAEQLPDFLARAEARKTLGKIYLAQWGDVEAARELKLALGFVQQARYALPELEIKLLLASALNWLDSAESIRLMTEAEARIRRRRLPHLRRTLKDVQDRIATRPVRTYFVLSDKKPITLSHARNQLLTWLLERSLQKTGGDLNKTAQRLRVTRDYVRKLLKRLNISGL